MASFFLRFCWECIEDLLQCCYHFLPERWASDTSILDLFCRCFCFTNSTMVSHHFLPTIWRIWGFARMVVPNNHGFSHQKWSFWGVLGYHHLRKHPYVLFFQARKNKSKALTFLKAMQANRIEATSTSFNTAMSSFGPANQWQMVVSFWAQSTYGFWAPFFYVTCGPTPRKQGKKTECLFTSMGG